MAEVLQNFLSGLRIWFCAKQVVANLQTLSLPQGARLALMLALYRATLLDVQVPGGSFTIRDLVQHPRAYRRELCFAALSLLKEIRHANREEVKSYASFNVLPNPRVKEHTAICDLALSLLMSTIGVGCKPSTLKVVKYAWDSISSFSPSASDIDSIMKMPDYISNDIINQPLETDEWLELARQCPDFLKSDG